MSETLGLVSCVVVRGGVAHVEARRCLDCGAMLIRPSLACPACGSRRPTETVAVSKTGRLYSYSIVHRSFPGVPTPFVSAIVDLDDGVTLKGNLRGVSPDPDAIPLGMPVKLVVDEAGVDAQGSRYLTYFFEAA